MPITASASVKLSQDELKKQAAWKAVEFVKSGMKVGLGTGSTAAFAVDRIGELLKDGTLKDIVAVPTSIRTYEQALSKGAPTPVLCAVLWSPLVTINPACAVLGYSCGHRSRKHPNGVHALRIASVA